MDGDTTARLVYLALLGAAVGGWAMAEMRGNLHGALRYLVIWGLIAVGLVAGYGLWQDLGPAETGRQAEGAGEVALPVGPDGHYTARLTVERQEVLFMVDTGASEVVLSPADAARLGFDPAQLSYDTSADTAGGPVRLARVTLGEVRLGPFVDRGLVAYVNEAAMERSLLGMSYLRGFGIAVGGGEMRLSR
jgi:aspartyl protease family protein